MVRQFHTAKKKLLAIAQVAGNVSGQALATAAAWGGRTRTLGACAPGAAAETPAPAALQALLAREPRSDGALVRLHDPGHVPYVLMWRLLLHQCLLQAACLFWAMACCRWVHALRHGISACSRAAAAGC